MTPSSSHPTTVHRLRIAAINFMNPAPLMWDFEHVPSSLSLAEHYDLRYTAPSECAASLLAGRTDLGLIPVAALTPELAIVPGCTIASLHRVRSIQLILKAPHTLATVRTVAADTASRSSVAYAEILFRKFSGNDPLFLPGPAHPVAMLQSADAALLIGDPALVALENRSAIEIMVGPCVWLDLAEEWISRTHLPWVAAVWAVHPAVITDQAKLTADLQRSRDHGLQHRDDLVAEWTQKIALPPDIIGNYFRYNIHYTLDPACVEAITLFRSYAAEMSILPALGPLHFL